MFFHLCLIPVLFSVPSLQFHPYSIEAKFSKNYLFTLVSVLFEGFLNRRWMCLSLAVRQSPLLTAKYNITLQTNAFCAGDEHFGARDKHVENECSNFSHTHTHTASYQWLLYKRYVETTATHLRKQVVSHSFTHLWVRYIHKLYFRRLSFTHQLCLASSLNHS